MEYVKMKLKYVEVNGAKNAEKRHKELLSRNPPL